MNDFSELDITGKEMAVLVLVVFVFMVVMFTIGYMFGIRNVHDNGAGTQPIGQQLNEAGTNISNATSGIGQAENHVGNVQAGIDNAQESTEYLQGTVSTSTELIADCKRILEAIRKRANTDKVTH